MTCLGRKYSKILAKPRNASEPRRTQYPGRSARKRARIARPYFGVLYSNTTSINSLSRS